MTTVDSAAVDGLAACKYRVHIAFEQLFGFQLIRWFERGETRERLASFE
jgi:hypothetical protein